MRGHRPFLIALALAAVVRVAVMVAFPPGFVLSDGPTYLGLVDDLYPRTDRTVGYGFLLDALTACLPRRLARQRSPARARAAHRSVALRPAQAVVGAGRPRDPRLPAGAVRRDAAGAGALTPQRRALRPPGRGRRRRLGVAPAAEACDCRPRRTSAGACGVRPGRRPAARRRRRAVLPVGGDDVACASADLGGGRAVVRLAGRCVRRVVPRRAWRLGHDGVGRPRAVHADHRLRGLLDVHDAGVRASRCARPSRSAPAWTPPITGGTRRTPPTVSCFLPASRTTTRWGASRGGRSAPNPARTPGIVGRDLMLGFTGETDRPLRVRHRLQVAVRHLRHARA